MPIKMMMLDANRNPVKPVEVYAITDSDIGGINVVYYDDTPYEFEGKMRDGKWDFKSIHRFRPLTLKERCKLED